MHGQVLEQAHEHKLIKVGARKELRPLQKRGYSYGMKRILLIAAALASGLLLLLVLGRHAIAERLVTASFSQGGFRLEVGRTRFHPLASSLQLSDLTLYNPATYPEPVAMRIRSLRVDYRLRSMLSDEQNWPLITIEIPEIHMVTLPDGRMNLSEFEAAGSEGDDAEGDEGEGVDYRIETLELKLGTMTMLTLVSEDAEPQIQVLELNLDKTYRDVIDTQVVVDDLSRALIMNVLPQMLGGLLGEEAGSDVESLFGDIRELGLGALLDGPAEVVVPPPKPASPPAADRKPDVFDELMQDL